MEPRRKKEMDRAGDLGDIERRAVSPRAWEKAIDRDFLGWRGGNTTAAWTKWT